MTFSPDKILQNTEIRPPFVLLFSPNGHGKTTFIASIGSSFIIDTEDKCNEVEGAFRYVPETFADILASLNYILNTEKVSFRALVIDTMDWLEKRIQDSICDTFKVKTVIDDKCKELNFGKGNILAANMFLSEVLPILEAIRKKHNIPIVLCAQQTKVSIKEPDKDEYKVVDLRLEPKLAGAISDKVEAKLYIQRRYSKDFKGSMIPTKERYLITEPQKGIAAKNSLHLPDEIPIGEHTGWNDFVSAINTNKSIKE
jgi:hypothetical protein